MAHEEAADSGARMIPRIDLSEALLGLDQV
jgi:hypothetical protein